MAEQDTFKLIRLALTLDESGQQREAIKAYAEVVEHILTKLPEDLKAKHKHFAVDALERAEKLKLDLNHDRKASVDDIHESSRITSTPGSSGTPDNTSKSGEIMMTHPFVSTNDFPYFRWKLPCAPTSTFGAVRL